jgi:hypothetical protein
MLSGRAVLAPFATIPTYILGAARSCRMPSPTARETPGAAGATWMALVTGMPTLVMLAAAAVRELWLGNVGFVSVAGTALTGLALAIMIMGVLARRDRNPYPRVTSGHDALPELGAISTNPAVLMFLRI